jgi:hypothetical protein
MISVDFATNFPFAEYKYKCKILWKCAKRNLKNTVPKKPSSFCGHFQDTSYKPFWKHKLATLKWALILTLSDVIPFSLTVDKTRQDRADYAIHFTIIQLESYHVRHYLRLTDAINSPVGLMTMNLH